MKNIKIFSLILAFTLLFGALGPAALAGEELTPPELQSASAIVIDANTGRALYAYNADEQRYPASLTKVMTVLLAVEAIERGEASLEDSVTAGDEAVQGMVEDGSTAGIQVGETMTLRDLLYCAMLSSANEACNIIAVHIAGSLDAFVEDMNARAQELGCTNTHFVNTHGLPDSNHYTTARDFAVITREAMSHETFLEISGTTSYTVPATNMSSERQLSNSNGLINPETTVYPGNFYEYARAGKTGHTNDAGYCLTSLAERSGVRLIAVVLGGQMLANSDGSYTYTNFTDSRTLYNWVFNNFSMQQVLGTTAIVTSVDVELAEDGGRASLRPQEAITALLPNVGFDTSTLERNIVIYSQDDGTPLTAPIAAGTVLGEITISLDGVVLGTSGLVTSSTVELARSEYMRMEIAAFFSNIWVDIILVVLVVAVAVYIVSVVRYRKLHRRHLQSLAEAEERMAREERFYTPVPPVQERTPAVSHTGAKTSVPRTTDELERTIVLTGVSQQRTAPPRQASAPGERTVQQRQAQPGGGAAPKPAGPTPRTQQSVLQQRPASPPRTGSSSAPTDDKARRDYFEEFFRNNGTNSSSNKNDKQ